MMTCLVRAITITPLLCLHLLKCNTFFYLLCYQILIASSGMGKYSSVHFKRYPSTQILKHSDWLKILNSQSECLNIAWRKIALKIFVGLGLILANWKPSEREYRRTLNLIVNLCCKFRSPVNIFIWQDQLNGLFLATNIVYTITTVLVPFPLSNLGPIL